MKRLCLTLLILLMPLSAQAQGYFQGTLYLDNEVPEVLIEDSRPNTDLLRVGLSNLKVYDQDNVLISVDMLRNRDPISYKYNAYTQALEVWVDLVELRRLEE